MLEGRRVWPNLKAADTNTFAAEGFTVLDRTDIKTLIHQNVQYICTKIEEPLFEVSVITFRKPQKI
jgi:hypothetical protein